MLHHLYALVHLLTEALHVRRDARIRFMQVQLEIMRRRLSGTRIVPTPAERNRLLSIGAELNHQVEGLIGIVTFITYRKWLFRRRHRRPFQSAGRPKLAMDVRKLVVRLARENPFWGFRRIVGEMRKLGIRIARTTVRNILSEAGCTPAPEGHHAAPETAWNQFLRVNLNTLVACDFFTKKVLTPIGMRFAYCLVFIHLGTRKVFLAPPSFNCSQSWVQQQGRNALMWLDEQKLGATHLLHDRGSQFSVAFDRIFRTSDIKPLRTPRWSPQANSFVESWIGSYKRECLGHFLCFSLDHLDFIGQEYVRYHNEFRPHRGLGNRTVPEAATGPPDTTVRADHVKQIGRVHCRRMLGGLLRHYWREAA